MPYSSNSESKLQVTRRGSDGFTTETLHLPLIRKRSISCSSTTPSEYPTSIASSCCSRTNTAFYRSPSRLACNLPKMGQDETVDTTPPVFVRPCPSGGFCFPVNSAAVEEDDNIYFPRTYLEETLTSTENTEPFYPYPDSIEEIAGGTTTKYPVYGGRSSPSFQQTHPSCPIPSAKARSRFTETSRNSRQGRRPILPHILHELAELTHLNQESQPTPETSSAEVGAGGDKDDKYEPEKLDKIVSTPSTNRRRTPTSAVRIANSAVERAIQSPKRIVDANKVLRESRRPPFTPSVHSNLHEKLTLPRKPKHKRNLRVNYQQQRLQRLEDEGLLTEQQSAYLHPQTHLLLERIRQRSYKMGGAGMFPPYYGKPRWNSDPRPPPKEPVESLASAEAKLRALDNGYYFPYFGKELSLYDLTKAYSSDWS